MNYHVARNGQQLGVLADHEISNKLASGELSGSDLAWAEGMAEWQPISSISSFSSGGAPAIPADVNPYAAPQSHIQPIRSGSAELASLGQRLGAVFLEGLAAIPGGFLLGFGMAGMDQETGNLSSTGGILAAVGGLYLLALVIYNLVRLSTHGQSIGKKWMGIRISSIEDDSNPGFVKAVLLRGFVNGIIGAIPFLGLFYSITDICFIFREDRRCIHDLIAGTHVVKC